MVLLPIRFEERNRGFRDRKSIFIKRRVHCLRCIRRASGAARPHQRKMGYRGATSLARERGGQSRDEMRSIEWS